MKMMIPPPMLPRHYSWEDIHAYWSIRPISIVLRLFEITGQLTPLMVRYIWDFKVLHSNHSTSNTSTSTATTANADDYEQDQEDKEEKERNSIMRYHAQQWRQALTRLGPAFVKMGQQLSIRPDLVPPVVLEELQKLCDSVTPISDDIAMQLLETELNCHPSKLFTNLRFVASASLGQVYRGTLVISDNDDDDDDDGTQQRRRQKEEEVEVAVKIQRPGMMESFSLDLFLLQQWGVFMDAWTSVITHQKPYHKGMYDARYRQGFCLFEKILVLHLFCFLETSAHSRAPAFSHTFSATYTEFLQNFAKGSYGELDYELEAKNQRYFQQEMKNRSCPVVIPDVYDKYTSRRVLTTQWMDGIRLSDADPETIRRLIPVGVELFLTQLLDIGAFHADPHPGNLLVTPNGQLCLLDFGLCAEVDESARAGMTRAIVNLLARDFEALVHKDAKQLGFLPHDYDTSELQPIMTKVLTGGLLESGSNLHARKRKLLEISNELNQVFFQYPFSVPPFFALVTRGLGLLEGIALTGDPEFDIFRASAPYATKRAMQMAVNHRYWTTKSNASAAVATTIVATSPSAP